MAPPPFRSASAAAAYTSPPPDPFVGFERGLTTVAGGGDPATTVRGCETYGSPPSNCAASGSDNDVGYAARFEVPIRPGTRVVRAARRGDGWRVETASGAYDARALVVATGIMSSPFVPPIPVREDFEGRVLHSIEYLRPGPFVGRRVLVVGAGNSAGEIAPELARAGARHHDLNAKNVLLTDGKAYVIDVDRVTLGVDPREALSGNLTRLEHSLRKWRDRFGARVSDSDIAGLEPAARRALDGA